MPPIRLTLLGGFSAASASGADLTLPAKARGLVAYLALRPGTRHLRDKLAALLWESEDARARDSLRHAMGAIRQTWKAGGAQGLTIAGDAIALESAAVVTDAAEFERLAGEGTPEAWQAAVELYQGDLLDGLVVDAPVFEEWLLIERERLRELAVEKLARLLAHQLALPGAHESQTPAILTARRLLALDPLQESVHRTLMRLYVRQGQRAGALRHYQTCIETLQREIGADPEPATRQLYEEIVRTRAITGRESRSESGGAAQAIVGQSLVGRESELTVMRRVVEDAARGHGRLLVLSGEAGIGKTALLGALRAIVGDGRFITMSGRAHASTQVLAFSLWVDAMRAGGLGREHPAVASLKPVWKAELGRLLPELAGPAPLPPGDPQRVFESVVQVMLALEMHGPVAILLDDLHWADDMSLRLLAVLARRVAGRAVLLAVATRPADPAAVPVFGEVVAELLREDHAAAIDLAPLSSLDIALLTERWMRTGTPPETIAQHAEEVRAVSQGNSHLAVEFLRAIREGSAPESAGAATVAERARVLLAARFERLSEHARRVLAVAATFGRDVEFALLRHAAELPAHDAAEAIEELARRGILEGNGEHFDFTHERIREVAYDTVTQERRAVLHGLVARSIEAMYPEQGDRFAAELGQHFERAGDWAAAASWFERASGVLTLRSAYRDASLLVERGLAALARIPDRGSVAGLEVDLLLALRTAYLVLGEFGRALECLERAQVLTEALGDPRRLARVLSYMMQHVWVTGGYPAARLYGERAVTLAAQTDDLGVRAEAAFFLGSACLCGGDYARAIKVLSSSSDMLRGPLEFERFGLPFAPSCVLRSWLAWALVETGRFE